jgi:hypothetical protein
MTPTREAKGQNVPLVEHPPAERERTRDGRRVVVRWTVPPDAEARRRRIVETIGRSIVRKGAERERTRGGEQNHEEGGDRSA